MLVLIRYWHLFIQRDQKNTKNWVEIMVGKRKEIRTDHAWITLENPRNGKINIRVCGHCGVMKSSLTIALGCSRQKSVSTSLSGWTQVDTV